MCVWGYFSNISRNSYVVISQFATCNCKLTQVTASWTNVFLPPPVFVKRPKLFYQVIFQEVIDRIELLTSQVVLGFSPGVRHLFSLEIIFLKTQLFS